MEVINGKVWILGDNVSTDTIISTRYMLMADKREMARHAFEAFDSEFASQFQKSDIIVAGHNFGCGSAREQAPEAIIALGAGAVVAKSFHATFFRNAINLGLPVAICGASDFTIEQGNILSIDFCKGVLQNLSTSVKYSLKPYPEIIRKILECHGLVNYYLHQFYNEEKTDINNVEVQNGTQHN